MNDNGEFGDQTSSPGWLRVPLGDRHWVSSPFLRTVLVVARTLGTTSWLLDLLPELLPDPRVQVVFTVEDEFSSVYRRGATDLLHDLRLPVVPWEQACATRFDLAIAASHTGRLAQLQSRLLLLPHGPGFGKAVSAPPDRLVPVPLGKGRGDDGKVEPSTIAVVSHGSQASLFDDLGGAVEILVAGDPVYDRLRASVPFRSAYRQALGVVAERRLVVVSSTWGGQSLFAAEPDFATRLLGELPVDEYAVAAVLHPNIWIGHSDWQVRTWLRRAVDAGLILVPPRDAWRAVVAAADVVVGDHGSVIFYAAAIGLPVLLVHFAHSALLDDSPLAELGRFAPELDRQRRSSPQIVAAMTGMDPTRYSDAVERMFAEPGRALEILRKRIYELIDLPQPAFLPRVLPVQALVAEHQRVHAFDVFIDVAVANSLDGRGAAGVTVKVERTPAAASSDRAADRHLAADIGEPDSSLRHHAAVLTSKTTGGVENEAAAELWCQSTLEQYPGCRVAAMSDAHSAIGLVRDLGDTYANDTWRNPSSGGFVASFLDPTRATAIDGAVLASCVYGLWTAERLIAGETSVLLHVEPRSQRCRSC